MAVTVTESLTVTGCDTDSVTVSVTECETENETQTDLSCDLQLHTVTLHYGTVYTLHS